MALWLVLVSPVFALGINCAVYLGLRRAFGSHIAVAILGGLGLGLAAIVGFALDSLGYADIDPVDSLVFWHQQKIPMSSSGLSRGSSVQHAPELADRWMVGTSPTMTTWVPTVGVRTLVCQIGTYMALSFCFWAFLNLNLTSLRIRVMRQLLHAGGSIAVSELLASYSDAERLQRRLLRLSNGQQIELIDGNWFLRSSLILIIARCIDLLRTIMGQRGKPRERGSF